MYIFILSKPSFLTKLIPPSAVMGSIQREDCSDHWDSPVTDQLGWGKKYGCSNRTQHLSVLKYWIIQHHQQQTLPYSKFHLFAINYFIMLELVNKSCDLKILSNFKWRNKTYHSFCCLFIIYDGVIFGRGGHDY